VAITQAGFSIFGGDLLIGNLGDCLITVYNPATYAYLGTIADSTGRAITYPGLWEIFGNTATGADPTALCLTAGLAHETHGLFGVISNGSTTTATPTLLLVRYVRHAGWHIKFDHQQRREALRRTPSLL
jgi:hypothetical protein